jgi:hypothetical protein
MHFALNVVQLPRFESKWNFKEQKYVEHSAHTGYTPFRTPTIIGYNLVLGGSLFVRTSWFWFLHDVTRT